jgi:hypothetical protein
MKTKIISLCMLTLILFFGTARTFGQGLSLGAKVGIGLAYFSNFDDGGDKDFKRSPDMTILGGVIMNYKFGKLIGLQTELLFQQKGEVYKENVENNGTSELYKAKIFFNYLTLPILIQASHSFGKFNLFGGLGPYVGYALNGKIIAIKPDKDEIKLEFGKDKFRRIDVGLSIDLGCGYKLGPGNCFLDLRYDLGFMDIQQIADKPDGYKTKSTRNFGIAFGYLIPLGKK